MAASAWRYSGSSRSPYCASKGCSKCSIRADRRIISRAPSRNGKPIHQGVDQRGGVVPGMGGQMGVLGGGEDRMVAEDLLHLQQVDPGLDQVSGIAVAIMPNAALSA